MFELGYLVGLTIILMVLFYIMMISFKKRLKDKWLNEEVEWFFNRKIRDNVREQTADTLMCVLHSSKNYEREYNHPPKWNIQYDQIRNTIRDVALSGLDDHLNQLIKKRIVGEEFVDDVVRRINNKQLER